MTGTSERTSPWPRLATSTAVFRGNTVLLGERGKGALAGDWSLPGGHVEPGEPVRDAARREVMEETAVGAGVLCLVDLHEIVRRDASGEVAWHYVIAVHYGVWRGGEPLAGSDCRATRFVGLAELASLPLTDGAEALIHRAAALVGEGRRRA